MCCLLDTSQVWLPGRAGVGGELTASLLEEGVREGCLEAGVSDSSSLSPRTPFGQTPRSQLPRRRRLLKRRLINVNISG